MNRICIFGGTTEGRRLAEFLAGVSDWTSPVQPEAALGVTVCVATEYGEAIMTERENLAVRAGRMDAGEMAEFFSRERFDTVINAVHPYAALAAENIAAACKAAGMEHIRLLRGSGSTCTDGAGDETGLRYFNTTAEAAEYLRGTEGNILVTTGAKELAKYTVVENYAERVYARILPSEDSIRAARECGIPGKRIIAMQGPFTAELNEAMLKAADAKYLVTKASGAEGGFYEKIAAAERAGAEAVVIGREPGQDGLSYAQIVEKLIKRFGIRAEPEVCIIGVGPGSRECLTLEAINAVKNSAVLIGSQRALDMFENTGKPSYKAILPENIAEIIEGNAGLGSFAALMTGDTGFYSGARKLMQSFPNARVIPGVSSASYFCARLGIAWDDVKLISLHGRDGELIQAVKNNPRTIALVGGADGISKLARELCRFGFGSARLTVGERLSYRDERVSTGTAGELSEAAFDALSIVLIESGEVKQPVAYGYEDEAFIRGDVPMTKSEVRSVVMSKLKLDETSVAYDIGSGTGSVAVEMAAAACRGSVYAVEKKSEALALIEANKQKFKLPNLNIIAGEAPEALRTLPTPTHAFIGGSSGGMRGIIAALLNMNVYTRFVITAVTLESLSDATVCAKDFSFTHFEAVQLAVAKSKKMGGYNMMMGQNPVYVISMRKSPDGGVL